MAKREKTKTSRGGKKVTTTKSYRNSYSKKTTLKTPRRSKISSYSDSYKKGLSKESSLKSKSSSLGKGTRKYVKKTSSTDKDSKNTTSANYTYSKSRNVKNPRKTKTSSSVYGYSSRSVFNKSGMNISRDSNVLDKTTSYKKRKSGKVKASGSALRRTATKSSDKYTGTYNTYKYKKKKSGKTSLKQRATKFNTKGVTTTRKKYKNGKLVKSSAKNKNYKK